MRIQFILVLPLVVTLGILPVAAENSATAPTDATTRAPRPKPIEPIVAPVRRVMPVTPPAGGDIVKGKATAKARAGKTSSAKSGKQAVKPKLATPSARSASRTAGKTSPGRTGAAKSVKAPAKPGKAAAKAVTAPATKKQAAAHTGPTR